MFAKKRTGGAAASGKNKQAKHTGPAAARASKSVDVQDGKSRFMQKAPAVLLSAPLIVVWTTLAVLAYWRLSPEVSESAKRFVDVQQCVPGELLPPPPLPSRVPFNVTSEVHRPLPCSLVRTHDSSHPQVNPCLHLPSRAPHPLVTCFMVFLHLLMPCVLGASQAGV